MVDLEQLLKDFNYEPREKPLERVSIWDDPFFITASMFSGPGEIRLVKKGVDLTAKGKRQKENTFKIKLGDARINLSIT